MFTRGYNQRKFVYPTLFFLLLLLLMLRYAASAAASEPATTADALSRETVTVSLPARHREQDFLDAIDQFNAAAGEDAIAMPGRTRTNPETRAATLMGAEDDWKNTAGGYFPGSSFLFDRRDAERHFNATGMRDGPERRNAVSDFAYRREHRRLGIERSEATDRYREERKAVERKMLGRNRQSEEYGQLERELHNLDRTHAERERDFQKRFTTIDAMYSLYK